MPESNARESAKNVMLLIGRLTVLRHWMDTPVVAKLFALCNAIVENDIATATMEYHSLTAALLDVPARRVTGDIWKDYVFAELIETPNRFSSLAAAGTMDPAVKEAMDHDLRLIQELFRLNSQQILDWINQMALEQKRKENRDGREIRQASRASSEQENRILNLAESAWFGAHPPKRQPTRRQSSYSYEMTDKEPLTKRELSTENWIQWGYAEPAELVNYIADEALAILYRKFLVENDWRNLTEDLMRFFGKYGSGMFLRYRWFIATDDQFYGAEPKETKESLWDELYGVDRAKEKLFANALSFLHRSKGDNMLLYGAEGMGKTSLVMALAQEPEMHELRLVFFAQKDAYRACEIIEQLGQQPFHFIAFLDDISMAEQDYRRLKRAFGSRMSPRNVLIWATATSKPSDSTLFPVQIPFAKPTFSDFQRAVSDMLRRQRMDMDEEGMRQMVQAACEQWRDESNDCSIRSANRLADRLIREYRIHE